MKVYGQLEYAQFHNRTAADPAAAVMGLAWFRTDLKKVRVDDSVAVREFVTPPATGITKGDLFSNDGTNYTRVGVGANDTALVADSTQTSGFKWFMLLPAGTVFPSAAAAVPTGFLDCDGSSKLRTDYPTLFTALGGAASPWGLPDGTHFNVPDFRGRTLIGAGLGAGLTNRVLAATVGVETHPLSLGELAAHNHGGGATPTSSLNNVGHTHAISITSGAPNVGHTHDMPTTADGGGQGGSVAPYFLNGNANSSGTIQSGADSTDVHAHLVSGTSAGNSVDHTHTVVVTIPSAGSGTAHQNMQPSAVVTWIIKT